MRVLLVALVAALVGAPAALADDWLPHPRRRDVDLRVDGQRLQPDAHEGEGHRQGAEGRDVHARNGRPRSRGTPQRRRRALARSRSRRRPSGLVNTDWSSNAPPAAFPILCAAAGGCNNSIASTYYALIWGTSRAGPRRAAARREQVDDARGGAQGDVTSVSDYVGTEAVSVPAFPQPVLAAKVRSEVTQAGALGDPYGSGVRTVWWVYGVGPVKIVFEHAGGDAPVTTSTLVSTNLAPKAAAIGRAVLPLRARGYCSIPMDELEAHEEAVGAARHRRRGHERVGAALRQARLGPDPGGRLIRLHDPRRRRHEPLRDQRSRRRSRRSRRSARGGCRKTDGAASRPRST